MQAYHFTGKTLRDGSPIPAVGEWLKFPDKIMLCRSGYHASLHPFDALQYAPGKYLHLVEVRGKIIRGDDKLVAEERCILASIDATDLLRRFARQCALDVIHLWDAPAVVREYLETGRGDLRVAARARVGAMAWDAARDAAREAARVAAWGAAWDAARDAAWARDAARARDAASAAARVAAWARDAARARARDAARDAAREKQRDFFKQLVDKEFESWKP